MISRPRSVQITLASGRQDLNPRPLGLIRASLDLPGSTADAVLSGVLPPMFAIGSGRIRPSCGMNVGCLTRYSTGRSTCCPTARLGTSCTWQTSAVSDWVSGVFAIGGVVLGVALEPVKNLFTSRDRTRQTRADRCAIFITEGEKCASYMLNLNAVYRAIRAGGRTPPTDQQNEFIQGVNTALEQMRTISALLGMYGPDEVASSSRTVLESVDDAFKAMKTPDDGEFVLATVPQSFQAKIDKVRERVDTFAAAARKYTR